jgi:hypothetical protein
MPEMAKGGIIFIRCGTSLPSSLSVTSNAFLPNWRIVTSHDRSALPRSIEGCTWYFFYLAGNIQATVLGGNTLRVLRKAVKRILTTRGDNKLNALEITAIVPRRFVGIPFTTFTAHSRHIQEGGALLPETKFVLTLPAIPVAETAAKHQPSLASRP